MLFLAPIVCVKDILDNIFSVNFHWVSSCDVGCEIIHLWHNDDAQKKVTFGAF